MYTVKYLKDAGAHKAGDIADLEKVIYKQLLAGGAVKEIDPNAQPEPINPTVQPPEGMRFTGSSPTEVAPIPVKEWDDLPTLEEAKAESVLVKSAPVVPAKKPAKKAKIPAAVQSHIKNKPAPRKTGGRVPKGK